MWHLDVGMIKSKINGFKKTTTFGIKCYFSKQPMIIIGIIFFILMIIFGISIRFIECKTTGGRDFSTYVNAMWFVGATMTTVGYGDYYPNTLAG